VGVKLPRFEKKPIHKEHGYGFDELIDELLELDPAKRPTCSEALERLADIRENINDMFSYL
jgi:serine/threonine protein kinase